MLPYLSLQGLGRLEARFDIFLEVVSKKAHQADVTWEGILYGFLFHDEAQKINSYLNERGANLSIEKRREILLAL